MLTKGDDYPIHQRSTPIAEVGTSRNFYDRYFFNGYTKDETYFLGLHYAFTLILILWMLLLLWLIKVFSIM